MYRVLIVDDEEPVLESYAFMLESERGFALAGIARSGYEALDAIYKMEPDLVFMDINIPGIDGLEVIAEVHRKFAGMVFILSTAYERFDLAQRAIPLGVFAYLVKPVSKKTFLSTLDKAREHLDARPRKDEAPDGEDLQQRFLRKTIWQEISEEDWERHRERFDLPSDKGCVCLLELGKDEVVQADRLAEKLAYHYRCLHDTILDRSLFLISGVPSREILERQLTAALREILPSSGRVGEEGVAAHAAPLYGIGGSYRGPELYRSCNEALGELGNKRSRTEVQLRERLRLVQLRRKIGIADSGEMKKLFALLWGDIFAGNDFTLAKAKMIPVFMFLLDDCTGCYGGSTGGTTAADGPPPFVPAEDIMALKTVAEWEAWAADTFDKLLLLATLRRSGNFPLPLVKAMEYIHGHYTEGIQLGDAAEAAQVSSAYLSRLFSEHLKTNFIDYLTELRIERAEKLIRESRMNIKEVAYAVGYQDPNYFSKIFRKITGLLPTQYVNVRGL
ncbi:MAG: helix-turn-helix domain-containing protein [Treponema sp.]|nr:helix-turn-helix domain-containing protein [Treponema sp.]